MDWINIEPLKSMSSDGGKNIDVDINQNKIAIELNSIFKNILCAFSHPLIQILIEDDCYFAGGCIRSIVANEQINDYDIYFKTKESADKFLELVNFEFKERKNIIFDHQKLSLLAKTKNAITLALTRSGTLNAGATIQFITKYTGQPHTLIENFDFSNCKAYFIPNKLSSKEEALNEVYIHPDMLWTLEHKAKCLKFNPKCWNPLNSVKRLMKFSKQGYNISNFDLQKLLQAVKNTTQEQFADFCNKDY